DRDLRLLIGREVLAATLAERLDRLAARLDLFSEDRGDLVLAELAPIALLDEVDGVLRHAQDVAAQGVTRPHRGGDVGLDPISKGHRNGYLGRGRVVEPAADEPERPGAGTGESLAAQPACVRAFFLRFASLRLRFTLGFS